MEESANPEIAAGKGLPAHWDPSDPRDLEMIRSAMKRYPKRFRNMDESAQAEVVEMVRLSAEQARRAAEAAETVGEITDAGRLAALSATVGAGLVKIQQADDHHADNLAAPKSGTTVNVGVQVNTMTDADRIRIATEAGVLHLLPAELIEKAKEAP